MQVNLTEEDLRTIWRDIYTHTFRTSTHPFRVSTRLEDLDAHKEAVEQADAAVALLRADRKDDAIAEDEREDAIAYLRDEEARMAARYGQPTKAEAAGARTHADDHVEFLRSEMKTINDAEVAARQPTESARTAEDERRDVLAFMQTEINKQDDQAEKHMSAAARERCSARAEVMRTISAYIERGDHVGAADRTEVKS